MPADKLRPSLRAEVSKLARLSHVQNGLPPAMRALPLVALALGEAISKATKSSTNVVEELMLGPDETFLLKYPPGSDTPRTTGVTTQSHQPARAQEGRDGVTMMCVRCAKQGGVAREGIEALQRVDELTAVKYLTPSFAPNGVRPVPKPVGTTRL